jgi:quercetin dioxygenase-like cupin family protein
VPRAAEPTPEQPISRTVVLDARFERVKAAERVEVREIRILAGHDAGVHVHNGPVLGSILDGSAIYQIEGQPESVLKPGDVFYEPEGARIARFDATEEGGLAHERSRTLTPIKGKRLWIGDQSTTIRP